MAIEFISWALKQDLPTGPKFVLVALANRANENGFCWPSQKDLAQQTGISQRSIVNHIKDLCKWGYLSVSQRRREDGYKTSNGYKIETSSAAISGEIVSGEIVSGEKTARSQVQPLRNNITTNVVIETSLEPTGHLANGQSPEAEFEQVFWPAYPKRQKKKGALKSFLKARKLVSLETIMHGLAKYKSGKPDYADWQHPTTWLNGEGWADEYTEEKNAVTGGNNKKYDPNAALALALADQTYAHLRGGGGDYRAAVAALPKPPD